MNTTRWACEALLESSTRYKMRSTSLYHLAYCVLLHPYLHNARRSKEGRKILTKLKGSAKWNLRSTKFACPGWGKL